MGNLRNIIAQKMSGISSGVKNSVAQGVSNVMYQPPLTGQEPGVSSANRRAAFKQGGTVGSTGYQTMLRNQNIAKNPSQLVGIGDISSVGSIPMGMQAPIPKAGSFEQIAEKTGGWQPGMRATFDNALFKGDANTVRSLLPKVPQEYAQRFATNISSLLGKVR